MLLPLKGIEGHCNYDTVMPHVPSVHDADGLHRQAGSCWFHPGLDWADYQLLLLLLLLVSGASKRVGLEGLADAVLSAASRLSGVRLRSTDDLPSVTLHAGLAHGSCFVQYQGMLPAGGQRP